MISQIFLGHLADIGSVQTDTSRCYIMETEHQQCYGGFSASGSSDNGRSLSPATGKVQPVKGILFRIRESEGYILE